LKLAGLIMVQKTVCLNDWHNGMYMEKVCRNQAIAGVISGESVYPFLLEKFTVFLG